jgi:hypothetical protein
MASLTVVVVLLGVPFRIALSELRGTNTASISGGSFNVSSGTLSCAESYNTGDPSPTISIPILCNDGRKGIVISTRDASGMSGGGHFTLSDGTTGDFIFGEAAGKVLRPLLL